MPRHSFPTRRSSDLPVSQAIISTKAKSLYDDLKKRIRESVTDEISFSATHGWFDRFQRRANLHNLKLNVEAASSDNDAASTYPARLAQLIEEGGYCARQVFNVEETECIENLNSNPSLCTTPRTQGLSRGRSRLYYLSFRDRILRLGRLEPSSKTGFAASLFQQ
jgi:hypothetical protein